LARPAGEVPEIKSSHALTPTLAPI
jgi:hypothetical protein